MTDDAVTAIDEAWEKAKSFSWDQFEKDERERRAIAAGEVKFGAWTYVPSLFVLNHDDGYQVDMLRSDRVSTLVAMWTSHLSEKSRKCFSDADLGSLARGIYEVCGHVHHDGAIDPDPISCLSATELVYPLPPAIQLDCKRSGVYCIRADRFVKIGKAEDVGRRIKELQTASPHRLELLAILSDTQADEPKWHSRLQSSRTTGEWFTLGERIAVIVRGRRLRDNFYKLASS